MLPERIELSWPETGGAISRQLNIRGVTDGNCRIADNEQERLWTFWIFRLFITAAIIVQRTGENGLASNLCGRARTDTDARGRRNVNDGNYNLVSCKILSFKPKHTSWYMYCGTY